MDGELILFKENKVEVLKRLKDGRIDYLESVYKLLIFSMNQHGECAGSDKLSISYLQEQPLTGFYEF